MQKQMPEAPQLRVAIDQWESSDLNFQPLTLLSPAGKRTKTWKMSEAERRKIISLSENLKYLTTKFLLINNEEQPRSLKTSWGPKVAYLKSFIYEPKYSWRIRQIFGYLLKVFSKQEDWILREIEFSNILLSSEPKNSSEWLKNSHETFQNVSQPKYSWKHGHFETKSRKNFVKSETEGRNLVKTFQNVFTREKIVKTQKFVKITSPFQV